MLFSRSTLNDGNKQSAGFMVFLTDLTDLKETQEELQWAEQRYRIMVQNAVQGFKIFCPQKSPECGR
jgi:PAS domain-containing protein